MRTVSIFKNGNNRADPSAPAIWILRGVSELEIVREGGQNHSASPPPELELIPGARKRPIRAL